MPRAESAPPRWHPAPAKINLALHVVGRRPDGYHLLDMLVGFADIGDRVAWSPGGDRCALTVDDRLVRPEPVPGGTANLAWRALALAGRHGAAPLSGVLTVEKHLPSGAGIGGGSGDAAATLRAVLGACSDQVTADILTLGADVPVCLAGVPSRVRGIGEAVEPVVLPDDLPIVLVWPGAGLPTPSVFAARAARDGDAFGGEIPAETIAALAENPLTAIAALRNDLEAAARSLLPRIGDAVEALGAVEGCSIARMSGSGSTVVGYFRDREAATAAAARLTERFPGWWIRSGIIMKSAASV